MAEPRRWGVDLAREPDEGLVAVFAFTATGLELRYVEPSNAWLHQCAAQADHGHLWVADEVLPEVVADREYRETCMACGASRVALWPGDEVDVPF